MNNLELSKIFYEIADILEMQEVEWKPRAYRKAAQAIENLSEDVSEIYKKSGIKSLEEIPGVGESIAEKIEEFLKTKHIKTYEKFKENLNLKNKVQCHLYIDNCVNYSSKFGLRPCVVLYMGLEKEKENGRI